MDEEIVRIIEMPHGVKGVTVKDSEGDYNIYLNSNLSESQRVIALLHEEEHIRNGDFYTDDPVWVKEAKNPF